MGVEVWSKLRSNFDTPSVETLTKRRPDFDQTSTPPVSKFGRSLLDISMTYILNVIKCLPNCDTKLRPNFDQTSTKRRPNVDQTSTLEVSKFGPIDDDRNNQQINYLFKINSMFWDKIVRTINQFI